MIVASVFHRFLMRPAFGFCRGVLPYNLWLLLPFIFFAQQCFGKGQEGFGLLFLFSPFLVMLHEIAFRRSRLPEPVAAAYDALFSDVITELVSQPFSALARLLLSPIAAFLEFVVQQAIACFWFVISLALLFSESFWAFLIAQTRPAFDFVSIRRALVLSHAHTIRAPSVVLL